MTFAAPVLVNLPWPLRKNVRLDISCAVKSVGRFMLFHRLFHSSDHDPGPVPKLYLWVRKVPVNLPLIPILSGIG